MGERPFPQLSLWALAAKAWQLIWPHVLGQIVEGKKRERGSVGTGREGQNTKDAECVFIRVNLSGNSVTWTSKMTASTFALASFHSLFFFFKKTIPGFENVIRELKIFSLPATAAKEQSVVDSSSQCTLCRPINHFNRSPKMLIVVLSWKHCENDTGMSKTLWTL